MTGAKLDGPISEPWVALTDLTNGDQAVWVGQGDANGNFSIPHVPDGNYTLTWWDEPQNYILDLINVTVNNGDINMGILPLTGWWTKYDGYVFNDLNRNGKRTQVSRCSKLCVNNAQTRKLTNGSWWHSSHNRCQWLLQH